MIQESLIRCEKKRVSNKTRIVFFKYSDDAHRVI